MEVKYNTSAKIKNILESISRTEDIKFSPDNKRFTILEFLENKIHLLGIDINSNVSPPGISITTYSLIKSSDLKNPHGICFLGNEHIVVCNRSGDVSIFKIPGQIDEINEFNIKAEKNISGKGYITAKVKTPGSVDCYQISDKSYRIFICNNYWNMVTSHIIEIGNSIKIRNQGVLIENSINLPDGISVSPDRKWISISNHVYGEVLIYENTSKLNRKTPPYAILKGPVCPHGIRFGPDGKRLYVADASSQYLHVYECEDGNWQKVQNQSKSIRLLDDETFYLGRYSALEGGLKGIDVDNSNSLLISTNKLQPVGFYNLNILDTIKEQADKNKIAELCLQRDNLYNRGRNDRTIRLWTLRSRVKYVLRNKYFQPKNYKNKLSEKLSLGYLKYRNKTSAESILDPEGPVLSLTSHGKRIDSVFYVIESIGLGSRKPSRIILWLNDKSKCLHPPKTLINLIDRGLEIRHSDNYGPHTKYYPYLQLNSKLNGPLVTVDDDILYPAYWLQRLIEAHKSEPSVIHCYMANRMGFMNSKFLPYNNWESCSDTKPSHANFINGVSGVIYPFEFLQYLKFKGDEFLRYCPIADDIWLTVNALRSGCKVAQIQNKPIHFNSIPGSQVNGLFHYNIISGGNQIQLIKTYSEEDISKLELCLKSETIQ